MGSWGRCSIRKEFAVYSYIASCIASVSKTNDELLSITSTKNYLSDDTGISGELFLIPVGKKDMLPETKKQLLSISEYLHLTHV
jgi:hypothetical protein